MTSASDSDLTHFDVIGLRHLLHVRRRVDEARQHAVRGRVDATQFLCDDGVSATTPAFDAA